MKTEAPPPRGSSLLSGLPGLQHGYLTKQEEARLGRIAMAGRRANPRGSTPEGRAAEATIVGHHIQLAVAQAKARCEGRHYDFEEVIAACLAGLAEAATVFDPAKGRFTTIANWYMQKHLGDIWGQFLPVPVRRGVISRYNAVRTRGPRTEDQARMLGDFERAAAACRIGDNRDDGEVDPLAPDADHLVDEEREHAEAVLRKILRTLTTQQRVVLRHRYGIGMAAKTFDEAGSEIGLSGERTRQIHDQAVAKLREAIQRHI